MKAMAITDLKKIYNAQTAALQNINLEVSHGEWVSILGPSGSGKSTLLNIIACLDRPTSGEVRIYDTNLVALNPKELALFRRENIGLVFQQQHLIPYLTALENVMLAQYYHSMVDEDEAVAALKRVGLGHRLNHIPAHLSGGEQQRVCIARALINDPKILLADEPTGNLDRENSGNVYDIFKQLHAEGHHTIVLVTHDEEAAKLGDRTVKIVDGRLSFDRTHSV
ncbi:MAG: ABC transporter ATP-binding protein [Actinobacteria bacterium]|nr:ABC transporter ATP-binding protein [Actinomycetota bacterium]